MEFSTVIDELETEILQIKFHFRIALRLRNLERDVKMQNFREQTLSTNTLVRNDFKRRIVETDHLQENVADVEN